MKTSAIIAVCIVGSVFADTSAGGVTNVLAVRSFEPAKHFYDASYWARIDTGATGTEGEPLDAGTDYLVRGKNSSNQDYYCCSPNGNEGGATFPGRSLTVGTADAPGHFRIYGHRNFVLNFNSPGLFLANGYMYLNSSDGNTHRLSGDVTILSPVSKPFVVRPIYYTTTFLFSGKLHGEASVGVCLDCDYRPPLNVTMPDIGQDYAGRLILRADYVSASASPAVSLNLGTTTVGAIEVRAKTRLSAYAVGDVVTAGTLKLEAGSRLDILASISGDGETLSATHSRFAVTGSLELPQTGKVKLCVPSSFLQGINGESARFELLSAPKNAVDLSKFELISHDGSAVPPYAKLGVESSGDVDVLCLVGESVVRKTVTDVASMNLSNTDTGLLEASRWDDGLLPHGGAHYVLERTGEDDMHLRIRASSPYVFPGKSLSLHYGCIMSTFVTDVTVTNLVLHEGSVVRSHNMKLRGEKIDVSSGEVYLETFNSRTMALHAPLSGEGTVVIRGYKGSDSGLGNTRFEVANPGFKGTIRLTSHHGNIGNSFFVGNPNWQTLTVVVPEALGAPLDAFNAKAVSVDKLGVFTVEDDITFADTTRGFYFGTVAQVKIAAGKTATFLSQWTLDGETCVRSEGTLALGGAMRFGSSAGEEPVQGKNLLTFPDGGCLKALSAGCVDGATVTFSNATSRIILEADASDDDLRENGVRNVKVDTPFVFPGDKFKIEFSLAVETPLSTTEPHTFGLVTVSSAAAEKLRGKIDVAIPATVLAARGRREITESVDPGSGDVTFRMCVSPVGFLMSIR